jgi:hypothetical protein
MKTSTSPHPTAHSLHSTRPFTLQRCATLVLSCLVLVLWESFPVRVVYADDNAPYKWISRVQTECEALSLSIATNLADSYNSFDENTEWDMRIHSDFLTEHLGFAAWITSGIWHSGGRTSSGQNAQQLQHVCVLLPPPPVRYRIFVLTSACIVVGWRVDGLREYQRIEFLGTQQQVAVHDGRQHHPTGLVQYRLGLWRK